MNGQFIDLSAPSLKGMLLKLPGELPHGLLAPPPEVRERVAQDKAKFPSHIYTADVEERVLNEWTLQYYFDYLGHEVVYRRTSEGPEVLAVGLVEALALRKQIGADEYRKLHTRLP